MAKTETTAESFGTTSRAEIHQLVWQVAPNLAGPSGALTNRMAGAAIL
jgi:hypothetical protein